MDAGRNLGQGWFRNARPQRGVRPTAIAVNREPGDRPSQVPFVNRDEIADYEGHSLAMLRRIAAALNQRVEIRFVPIRRTA